jgi:ABC-2 type transport system ATP-binding protein
MSTPAVALAALTKHYPVALRRERLVAVRDLTLEIPEGEVFGLLGPNGSGKSTTLKLLLGLATPTSGTAHVFGHASGSFGARSEVGFLPENPYFYKFLTGAETLAFYGKLCGLRGKALTNRTDELLDLVGLQSARDRRVGGYSKGMLQRIGLAQAIIQQPRLVVLDEPTAGVDPAGSRQIRDLILTLKKRGTTILLTSHLLEQVQDVCDRVGIMARGHLVRLGPLDELVSVDNQTQFIVENADPTLAARIESLIRDSNSAATLLETRRPQRSLEKVFLEVTGDHSIEAERKP